MNDSSCKILVIYSYGMLTVTILLPMNLYEIENTFHAISFF